MPASAGSAIAGLKQLKHQFKKGETVVVVFHDHGTRYVGKMFNPQWMRMMGYETVEGPTARELVKNKRAAGLVSLETDATVDHADNDTRAARPGIIRADRIMNGRTIGQVIFRRLEIGAR